MKATEPTTNIRIRLTASELEDLETVRQFLGLRSVSAAAARLCLWNARILATSLRSDSEDENATTISEVVQDAVKLSLRKALAADANTIHLTPRSFHL